MSALQDKMEMLAKAKSMMTTEQTTAMESLIKKQVISHWLKTMASALGQGGAKDWTLYDFVDTGKFPGSHCACGQAIRYEYYIENVKTNEKLVVGSSCISTHTSITPDVVYAVKKGVTEITSLRDEVAEAVVKAGGWAEWITNNMPLIEKFLLCLDAGVIKNKRAESMAQWLIEHSLPIPESIKAQINAAYSVDLVKAANVPAGVKVIVASSDWGKCSHKGCAAPDIKKGQEIYKKDGQWYHAACPTSSPTSSVEPPATPTPTVSPLTPAVNVPMGAKVLTASSDWGKCNHSACKAPDIKTGQQIYKHDGKWFHVECPKIETKTEVPIVAPQPKTGKPAKVEMPIWLAKDKKCSTIMQGMILDESPKAVYFKGNCVIIEDETHCMCCHKELTHPVSIMTKYGPECAKNLGVNHPGYNKKDFTDAEVEEIKAMIKAVTFEGWLPKSKVNVTELSA